MLAAFSETNASEMASGYHGTMGACATVSACWDGRCANGLADDQRQEGRRRDRSGGTKRIASSDHGCVPIPHINLGASISEVSTASDASGRGGAVGLSTRLSPAGQSFTRAIKEVDADGVQFLFISLQWHRWGLSCI